jgi:hypothetical protein
MAKHRKTTSDEVVKTYSFKVRNINRFDTETILRATDEYQRYYNSVSDWIKDHLTTKIGDLLKLIPEDKQSDAKYIKTLTSDEWKDRPLYLMFKKEYPSNDRDNAIYKVIESLNPEAYCGNILGFSTTYYRRCGYVACVISNYLTKISKMSTGAKKRRLTDESDDNAICEQVIYEMEHNGLTSERGWTEHLEYLESKSDTNQAYLERMRKLSDYYKSHSDEVNDKMEKMAIESLIKFGGCHRKDSKKSMFIMGSSQSRFDITQTTGNNLNINFVNILDLDVYGRRDVIKDGKLLVDLVNNHGDSLVLKLIKGELYVDVNCTLPFEKAGSSSTEKVVGIDVNIKHEFLATDIPDDGKVVGYVNLYKEVVNDPDFRKVCPSSLLKDFEEFSGYVWFCPIELNLLFSRISKQLGMPNEDFKVEEAFVNVLRRLEKTYIRQGENVKRIYVQNLLNLRSQIKANALLWNKYSEEHGRYDIDKSEEYIQEHPFSETECGQNLLAKIDNTSQKILGCRNNIIQYAYSVFAQNGYTILSLEKLTSSQFEKVKSVPPINSILNYHKVLGCTDAEVAQKKVYSIIKRGYYDFEYDGDRISGAKLSEVGKAARLRDDLFNRTAKSIHFADVKDYFVTLSNNGKLGVSLGPPSFTSQMDSITHNVLCEKDKSGQLRLANKKKVRPTQERHINGLNADFNAARNIAYLTSNDTMRKLFLKPANTNKTLYNKPAYETFIKSQATVVTAMKKEGMVSIIEE